MLQELPKHGVPECGEHCANDQSGYHQNILRKTIQYPAIARAMMVYGSTVGLLLARFG